MPAILSDTVSDLVAAADKMRADDRLVTDPFQMLNELEALFEVVTKLQAVAIRRLREVFHADATVEVCGRGTKPWLREEALLAGGDASRYMRLLHGLRCYPATEAAFDAADISMAHAVAIMSALETLPPHLRPTIEPLLVEQARFAPPEAVAGFIDELLETLGIDKASEVRRERRHAQRGVDLHKTLHGSRVLNGNLTADVGDVVERALELAAQPNGDEDKRNPRQRQHDALGAIAAAYLTSNSTPSFDGAPRTMIVTIDLATLENQLHERWIRLPDGATINAATARRLACDAAIIPVVLGGDGAVLDVGEAGREFNVGVRRASYLRDEGRCAFPNCQGRVVELHHIVFRRNGGPNSLDNAAWLCAFHHWLVHEGRWTLVRDPVDKSYLWTGPFGHQRVRRLGTA